MAGKKYCEWIEPDGLLAIKGWARDGLSNEEIARNIGISRQTFFTWRKQYQVIFDAVKEGRRPVAVEVEDSLYGRCQWREVEETETKYWEGKDGREHTSRIVRTRWIPPDTACIIYAIKNLLPQRFSDKPVDKSKDAQQMHTDLVSAIKSICEEQT